MRKLLILAFILCSFYNSAQTDSSNIDPRVLYSQGTIHIEPAKYKLISYQVSLLRKHTGDLIGPYTYSRGGASKDALGLPQNAMPGDTLFFEEIKVQGLDGRIRNMNPIKIVAR